jgi:hypothetical protein
LPKVVRIPCGSYLLLYHDSKKSLSQSKNELLDIIPQKTDNKKGIVQECTFSFI